MGKARIPQIILESHEDRLAEDKLTHAYGILFPAKIRPVGRVQACKQEDMTKEHRDEGNGYLREGLL